MSNKHEMTRQDERLPSNLRGRLVATPPVDIYENDEEYVLEADVPGVAQDRVTLRLENGELSLEAQWSVPEIEGATVLAREFRPVDFRRSFVLPDTVDAEKVSASLKDGVLTVRIPKGEAVRPRSIQIRAG
ncbi:MAG: Hsp20/alpha crystallin family protein [Deltaproteobacteria bacterium]|nr:Hsp20/alpha crystallin family protein [Deltaproteobacteria bacterium]